MPRIAAMKKRTMRPALRASLTAYVAIVKCLPSREGPA
jgi:hypothetical protein